MLPAIGNSLAKAASETGVARASRSVKKSPGVLVASLRALAEAIAKERNRPGSGPAGAPPRPAWVDAEPGMVGEVYRMTAMVGPFATRQECDEAQPDALREVAADYLDKYVGPAPPYSVRVSPEFLQEKVVTETWEEERMTDFGPGIGTRPMIRRYVLLEFTKEVQNELKRQQRLWYTGYGLAGVLAVLGLAFAYLKINLATGGRYRGRLRAAAVAVILAAVVAVVLIPAK